MTRIICLGMSALDAIYRVESIPAAPAKVLATAFLESGGGMAASASVAVARLGGAAEYWGRLGADPLGDRILAQLVAEGVDVGCVRRLPGVASPSAAILVAADGERLVCAYNDPRLDPDPGWLPVARVAAAAAVMADVRWPAGAARLLDSARLLGRPAVFDGDVGPVEALLDLAGRASHAAFSTPGLAQATGDKDPGAGLARLAAAVPAAVVGVTLGADGFLWREAGREFHLRAPKVRAVDTLAAGDVWHGAFTLALGEGRSVALAAQFANAAAAIKCTRVGGRLGAPRRAEVEALVAQTATTEHRIQ
jgi:sulfofructose kinase